MKIIIDIPDDEVSFGMKVLKSLSFIKKARPLSEPQQQLWKDLNEAAEQVKQHKLGKIHLKSAKDLLDEL
ncbi:MAG: hypothetical protein ACK4WD_12870 [Flavobacteriales bacterium]|jgi:hypothetical protein